ncbi:MAG: tetratricopeptide repeat protein [Desulfobacteraceae bacterium]|nr:tetratricopeptide repeat protein [Desulfobacteraceae bacterium]
MKPVVRMINFILTLSVIMGFGFCETSSAFSAGDTVPNFSLKDINEKVYDLSSLKNQPMVIIYFFDVDSRSSQEGLLTIDDLAKQYKDVDLLVWGITTSSKEKVLKFNTLTNPTFPILMDTTGVSQKYKAQTILPTICITGPELKVLDFFQGGGKTTEIMLVKLAERTLQQKKVEIAKAISGKVVTKNPGNVEAKSVHGYASLKAGDVEEAEKTFYELSREKGDGAVLGKEGLSTVYAQKGQTEKSLAMAEEVEMSGPGRAYVHVVKGDLLYSQNKKTAAEVEYKKAIAKKQSAPYQKAVAYNQLGRLYANRGNFKKSRELYAQAVSIDPYYIEATANRGLTYEKEGDWAKALENYRQALAIDKSDPFAATLAKNAKERLLLEQDEEKRSRIDKLVDELVLRYRDQTFSVDSTIEDDWTSQPMILTFTYFSETGGLTERDGFSTVLTSQLADQLNASGRVQVVDLILIERLLERLNLKTSDLAEQETALKLGKVLSARIIGTGAIFHVHGSSLITMRLVDTETTDITKVINGEFGGGPSIRKDMHQLNREILTTVIQHYPLQAFVVDIIGNQVLLNLGADQGVVLGTRFDVIEDKPAIEYRGKKMKPESAVVAQVEVVKLEKDFAYGHLKNTRRPIVRDDKLRENIDDIVFQGQGTKVW